MGKVKRPYQSKLRAEQAEATRRRILDAARRLFARQGYEAATMDLLAEEAGVAVQTLYAAFGSKLQLAAAVVHDVLASTGIPELVRQAGESGDAETTLRNVARINRLVDERLVELHDLLSAADLRETARVSAQLRERDLSTLLATVTSSPRRRADMSDDEVLDTLVVLTAPSVYRALVVERSWSPDRYERWLGDLLITTLLTGR